MGNWMEPMLLDWLQDQIGKPVLRDTQVVHDNGIMIASLDGLIEYGTYDEHAEAKYSSMPSEWGEPGTDEIPDAYLLQIAHQFACLPESVLCHVPVALVNHGAIRQRYQVEREKCKDLIDVVEARAVEFWEKHVLRDVPPEGTPTLEVAKLIRRTPGVTVSIPDDLGDQYCEAEAEAKAAAERLDGIRAAVLAAMGTADRALCRAGEFSVKTIHRKAYEVKASSYQRFSFKKSK